MASNVKYDHSVQGIITAVRIYNAPEGNGKILADVAFETGMYTTIEWSNKDTRKEYLKGTDVYTVFYDTRCDRPFSSMIRQ